MADSLELLRGITRAKIERLRGVVLRLRTGRGSHLGTLITHCLDRLDAEIKLLDSQVNAAADNDSLLMNISRKFERLQPQIDIVHHVLATYQYAIGRPDVPVGLQHLIDILMDDILVERGDPLVHLNPTNMYSTIDLVALLDDLFRKFKGIKPSENYRSPHPIAFNLPALDPDNALLSPLLAHEVAHSAVQQVLMEKLSAVVDDGPAKLLDKSLTEVGATNTDPIANEWTERFRDWCSELICDAVALVLTGPSFLFAFAAFAPPSGYANVGTHPPLRDRLAFHLKVLDQLGWTGTIRSAVPNLHDWFCEVSTNSFLIGNSEERFLRGSMEMIEQNVIDVAVAYVSHGLDATETDQLVRNSVEYFQHGIPNVEVGSQALSPWQVVFAGWRAVFADHGDLPESLAHGAGDREFNAVLVKALEMSGIVTAWRSHERPAV